MASESGGVLPSKEKEAVLEGRERIFIKWENLRDAFVQRTILTYIRKWIDGIDHYTDFVVRKIQSNGIYLEHTFNVAPLVDGYNIYITMRVVGVDAERVARRYSSMKRIINYIRQYRDVYRTIAEEAEAAAEEVMESGGGSEADSAEEAEEAA
jgi:hypothetical protein